MFSAAIQTVYTGTDNYLLISDQDVLNYDQVIEHCLSNESFRTFFIQTLIDSPYLTYRFETPPLSTQNRFKPFEFVLIDSPWLDRPQDSVLFEEHFQDNDEKQVVVFNNLGGDATLIVPTPVNEQVNYAHFAAFLRTAADSQKDQLLLTMVRTLVDALNEKPIWLSTAGGGVDWLHIRLDKRPKYYAHQPYRLV